MNIVLIGYRGTGKTSVAQHLALRLGRPWVDADVEVELAAGKPIAGIFHEDGESFFRDLESEVLLRLLGDDNQVIALGGGAILRPENRQRLHNLESVVWLKASPDSIHCRLASDPATIKQRPNLTADGGMSEIIQVLAEREALYHECAGVQVDTENKDIADVAEEIIARLNLKPTDT